VYRLIFGGEDDCMLEAEFGVGLVELPRRRRRSAAERRLIVEETLEAGTSVSRVAQKHGVNANQVFQWRRLYRDGHLGTPPSSGMKLLPVRVVGDGEAVRPARIADTSVSAGAIHVELPGEVRISFEGNVDPAMVRAVLASLRG
jgi:transposase